MDKGTPTIKDRAFKDKNSISSLWRRLKLSFRLPRLRFSRFFEGAVKLSQGANTLHDAHARLWLRALIQDFAHFVRQRRRGKRFLQQHNPFVQDALIDNGILGIG